MKKWKHACIIAIFLDLLNPICCLITAFQEKEHDPVKAVQRIQEFNWTLAKLKILTKSSLEGQNTCLTHCKQFLDKIDAQNNGWFSYQNVKLSKYTDTKNTVSTFNGDYADPRKCGKKVRKSFNIAYIFEFVIFAGYIDLVDWLQKFIHMWRKPNLNKHFNYILLSNSCDIYQVQTEWDIGWKIT